MRCDMIRDIKTVGYSISSELFKTFLPLFFTKNKKTEPSINSVLNLLKINTA